MEKRLGVCNLCEAICGIELTIEDNRVTGVRGNPNDPLSRGHICPKGTAIGDIYSDPDRLKHPVKRVGEGADATWQEISWEEAFELTANQLAAAINEHGDDALAIYLGNPNVHALGALTHGVTMANSFRTRNKFSATSVDQLPHQLMSWLLYGHQLLLPIPDLDRTDYILMFGANPMISNGSLMTAPDFPNRMRALKARGGSLVVVDPRRTETAKVGTEHVFVRPGTDAWVLLALLNTVLGSGAATPPAYVDNLDAVTEAVAVFTPERAEAMSGVPATTIRRLAEEFLAAPSAVAYGRMGVSTHEFGTVCQWAIQMLNLVTGNLDRVGGAMLTNPAINVVDMGLLGPGHLGRRASRVRGLKEFGGELPVSVLCEEIETPGEGQIRALITSAGNPVLSTPNGAALDRALAGLDFFVAIDFYINETTRHASVILPPASALERDHYDLVFHQLAVRNTARFTPAIFTVGRDQRQDWEIYKAIALRTQSRLNRKAPLKRRMELRARLQFSPTFLVANLLRLGRSGATISKLRAHPEGIDLGPLRPEQFPQRLRTKNKRIDAAPSLVLDDLARLMEQQSPVDGELLLIGRRGKQDNNSWGHNLHRLTKGRARHQLFVNPGDLASRGLNDGAIVTVTSRVGSVRVEALATDDIMPGVVSLPHGYGHGRAGTQMANASLVRGVSINDLTDPERLDVSGNAAFSGVPVTVS